MLLSIRYIIKFFFQNSVLICSLKWYYYWTVNTVSAHHKTDTILSLGAWNIWTLQDTNSSSSHHLWWHMAHISVDFAWYSIDIPALSENCLLLKIHWLKLAKATATSENDWLWTLHASMVSDLSSKCLSSDIYSNSPTGINEQLMTFCIHLASMPVLRLRTRLRDSQPHSSRCSI